jgi:hypothetical protein
MTLPESHILWGKERNTMRPKRINLSGFSVLAIVLTSISTLLAQSPFEVPITVTDGYDTTVVYFGILPDAHYCITETDGFNGHFEYFFPPGPPVAIFDARFISPRAGLGYSCFDQGSPNDFRPFISPAQRDTFRIRAQVGQGTHIVFIWPSGLAAYFAQLTFRYFNGTANVYVNMLTDTTVDITDPGDVAFGTITSGDMAGPGATLSLSPTSLAFGDVPAGSNSTLQVIARNAGTRDTLSIVAVSQPFAFTVTPNPPSLYPIELGPGESRLFDVTFAPNGIGVYYGNIVFIHSGTGGSTDLPVTGRSLFIVPTQRARLNFHDGAGWYNMTLWFGFHVNATIGIDPGLGEYEIPPIPPVGARDVRFVNPPGHNVLGQGVYNDYHRYVSPATIDTHVVRFQPEYPPGYPITLSWIHSEIQAICDSAVLVDITGSVPRTRMDLRDSLVVTDGDVERLQLYVYGQHPERVTHVEKPPPNIPKAFALFQNYPNPFNSSTTIVFRVRTMEFVSLKVYDVLGREVATLMNEVKEPGEYTVEFDASRLASGVYLYKMNVAGFVSTRRLLLLK